MASLQNLQILLHYYHACLVAIAFIYFQAMVRNSETQTVLAMHVSPSKQPCDLG